MRIRIAAIALSVVALAGAPALLAQQPPQQPERPAAAQPSGPSLTGDLIKVDSTAKTITVKAADGAETVFAYNDATTVTGAKDVAGLATMTNQRVTVNFNENAQTKAKTATKITVQPKAQ
jgi:hypothetical protein